MVVRSTWRGARYESIPVLMSRRPEQPAPSESELSRRAWPRTSLPQPTQHDEPWHHRPSRAFTAPVSQGYAVGAVEQVACP
jgi:hypothetical protein